MPTNIDLDQMTEKLTEFCRFDRVTDFEQRARIMELAIMAVRNNIERYKR